MRILRLILILSAFICVHLRLDAQTITTATITVTNVAGTTNGQTLVINGVTRTWTNNVLVPSVQILTNSASTGANTNLFNQLALNPVPGGTALSYGSSTSVVVRGFPGQVMTVTLSAGWGAITYATNTLTSARAVRVPLTVEAAGPRAEIASQLVTGLNDYSTNSFFENSISVSNLVGRTNTQTISGPKDFTSAAGVWRGLVTNALGISGNIAVVSNGVWWHGKFHAPILTNGVNYGNAFRSPGSGTASEQFGTSASATGTSGTAVGASATATGESSAAYGYSADATGAIEATAIGANSEASADDATAVGANATAGHTNSTAIGAFAETTANDQVVVGHSSQHVSIPGGLHVVGAVTNLYTIGTNTLDGHIKFIRKAVTTLATGNNAAVPIFTNTFVEVSGPGGAFAINGIANGSDGRFLIIVNQTGFDMTIAHQSGTDPTAGNRIINMTGADRATTANGAATLIYSGAASRWILISLDP